MKSKDYVPLGDTTVPLTPLLLVFCALGFALLGLLYALINLMCANSRLSRNGRQIIEERARAKQELRVRGGAARSALSPGGSPTPGSSSSLENGARRLPPNKVPKRVGGGHRSSSNKRSSRGYRGTSFSLADAGKKSDKLSQSTLGLPVLTPGDASSGSSVQLTTPRDLETGEQARLPLSYAGAKRVGTLAQQGRGSSNGSGSSGGGRGVPGFGTRHLYRTSSSVGLGADLYKLRQSVVGNIPVHPSAMDRTYATPEYGHPLDHSNDLRRHVTEPNAGASTSRRNSSYSIYDNTSSEAHSFNESMANSRMGSFSLANSNPLQPLGTPQFGHGSFASMVGHLGSGSSSPHQTGYSTPVGGGPSVAADPRLPLSARYAPRKKSYESDDGDAITPQSRLLAQSGKRVQSPPRI
ncbi:hypothetical protein ACQY0O_007411 [Thecaphora frezii]